MSLERRFTDKERKEIINIALDRKYQDQDGVGFSDLVESVSEADIDERGLKNAIQIYDLREIQRGRRLKRLITMGVGVTFVTFVLGEFYSASFLENQGRKNTPNENTLQIKNISKGITLDNFTRNDELVFTLKDVRGKVASSHSEIIFNNGEDEYHAIIKSPSGRGNYEYGMLINELNGGSKISIKKKYLDQFDRESLYPKILSGFIPYDEIKVVKP